MLKVLIVDDELLARLALRTAIDWEEYGFEVVAEAEDGLTGFLYVEQFRPDIVLTDISMPGINGVELVKKIKEHYPETEIIILSCHNDFEYVKEGLRAGAADYILKLSMSMEDLLKELLQLKEKIRKKDIESVSLTNRPEKERWPELLFSLIASEEPCNETAIEQGRAAGLIGEGAWVLLAALVIDDSQENRTRISSGLIEKLVESVMVRYHVGNYIPVEHNRGIILCQMNKEEYGEKMGTLRVMLEELLGLIHDYLSTYASAGISSFKPMAQLKTAYKQAYDAVSHKFYTGPGKLHDYEAENREEGRDNPDFRFHELLKAVPACDFDEMGTRADQWLDLVMASRRPDLGTVRKNLHELLFQIESNLLTTADEKSDMGLVEKAYHQIQRQLYAEELRLTLQDFLTAAQSSYEDLRGSKREIVMARKYVSLYYEKQKQLFIIRLTAIKPPFIRT